MAIAAGPKASRAALMPARATSPRMGILPTASAALLTVRAIPLTAPPRRATLEEWLDGRGSQRPA